MEKPSRKLLSLKLNLKNILLSPPPGEVGRGLQLPHMSKYESKIKLIPASVEQVYATLSNLENFRPILDAASNNPMVAEKMKEAGQDPSQLEKLKDVQLSADRIAIPAPMIGELALRIIEREENKTIKFETEQSPVDANLWIQVLPTSEISSPMAGPGCKMRLTLKAELNMMMKMMIGSKLEDGIDKFADMLSSLPYTMIG